jgi:hypothetical protein
LRGADWHSVGGGTSKAVELSTGTPGFGELDAALAGSQHRFTAAR